MTVKDILIAARTKIELPENWCKGLSVDKDGRMCALAAVGWHGWHHPLADSARDALISAGDLASVADYNDHPDTTHEDILALFDRAIEAAS